jgi:dipeptidyl aminopeptidase/acylaminoacyl peptidase
MRTAVVTGMLLGTSLTLPAQPRAPFTLDQVTAYPFPAELAASATGTRMAFTLNERGARNLWVADAPAYTARKLTAWDADEGQEIVNVSLSADGKWVAFARGGDHGSNFDGLQPVNPAGLPGGTKLQVWVVPFDGGAARAVADGDAPVISPRGDRLVYEKDGQLWVASLDGSTAPRRLFAARGSNASAEWSPDGSRLAFVSSRGDHAFVGVYTNDSTPIAWMAPSTSRDGSPRWSPDGAQLAFIRRPGGGGAPDSLLARVHQPWGLWVADVRSGQARKVWQAPTTARGSYAGDDGFAWAAGGRLVYSSYEDGWPHLFSVAVQGGAPLLLTPGAFQVEAPRLTSDGASVVYAANTGAESNDIDRRHLFVVPVDKAQPRALTRGTGLEFTPVPLGNGTSVALLSATAQRPPLPAVMPLAGGAPALIAADRVPANFPAAALVTPRAIVFKAADGTEVHGQLFEPAGGTAAGAAKKPAIVYVHGGPQRQMLLGWHPLDYYANGYAMNQYLASQGFMVLSVNYRLGTHYGFDFHRAVNAGAQGAAEYLDVKAAGEWLRAQPTVDATRMGIYGGSYGGFLTALALGRDSQLWAAGVDIHGVHDFTRPGSGAGRAFAAAASAAGRMEPIPDLDAAMALAWQSSPVASVATWRSPVLLIHGDDDRNVRFSETVDLARRLAARNVEFEELVIPDDTHHFMRHANQRRVNEAAASYLQRKLMSRVP